MLSVSSTRVEALQSMKKLKVMASISICAGNLIIISMWLDVWLQESGDSKQEGGTGNKAEG